MTAPGAVLNKRYQIIRLLGRGGMGAVYLARDTRLARNVAVKENVGGNKNQFQREAVLLANLDHPNLPRVHDHFSEPNGAQYLVMDFIEGDDLETLIEQQGALPEAKALHWFDQILDAVAYLHQRNIIHRDIKPANIKITPQDKAVLVDFGIAKLYRSGQYTMTGAKAATPGYAAPEQYRGGTDMRTDIYSLCATLYTLVTGRTPPDAYVLDTGSATLVPPRVLNPAVPVHLEQAILRGMSVKLEQRFQNIGELRAALSSGAPEPESEPVVKPHTTSTVMVDSRRASRNLVPLFSAIGIGVLILVLVAIGVAVMAIKPFATPTPAPVVVNETKAATITATQFVAPPPSLQPTLVPPTFTSIPTSRPVLPTSTSTRTSSSLTGQIAFESNRDGNYEIYSMNSDGTNIRRLTNDKADDRSPVWSPLGRLIAFQSKRFSNVWAIFAMNVDGTSPRMLYASVEAYNATGEESDPAWSFDGNFLSITDARLAASTDSGGAPIPTGFSRIQIVNVESANTRILNVPFANYGAPAWAPDGRMIAFHSSQSRNFQIYVVNSDSTNLRRLTNNQTDDKAPVWSPDGRSIAFQSNRDGHWQIYVMNADGTNVRRLTNFLSNDIDPAWSPDGNFIAFASDRDGNFEIYIMNADGTNPRRITNHPAYDGHPSWSPR